MRRFTDWCVRFAKAIWRALGWRHALLTAAVGYGASYWDWLVQRSIDYVPPGVFLVLSAIPGWLAGITTAAVMLAFFLAIRSMTRVKLEFEDSDPGCVVDVQYSGGGPWGRFFRLKVSYLGMGSAYFSGFLAKVEQHGRSVGLTDSLALTFAPAEDGKGALRKLIYDGVPARLDVVAVMQGGPCFPCTEFDPSRGDRVIPNSCRGLFSATGDYELQVVVASDDGASENLALLLHYTGDWKTTWVEKRTFWRRILTVLRHFPFL